MRASYDYSTARRRAPEELPLLFWILLTGFVLAIDLLVYFSIHGDPALLGYFTT
jgi:hypothetical protein